MSVIENTEAWQLLELLLRNSQNLAKSCKEKHSCAWSFERIQKPTVNTFSANVFLRKNFLLLCSLYRNALRISLYFVKPGEVMSDREVELKETPPAKVELKETPTAKDPPPSVTVLPAIPPKVVEGIAADIEPTQRLSSSENLPRTGRRVSSIEVVKGAPPPKRASVVVFESPDTPPPTQKFTTVSHGVRARKQMPLRW
ncbi:hypothetical protein RB195_001218 [Necator americanus]|uniref:Uncharacterized protein n=1 Tax=Necator americanus TaxID=51031 RepID=A0ABR1DDB6_NECAM